MSRTFKALSIGQPFLFDAVETNIGNGYDRKTGIFTAPSKGVYAFSWTIHAAGSHHAGSRGQYGEMAAVLTQNGVVKGSIYADTEKASDDASATGFVILASEKGEKFQIICPMAGQGAFYSTRLNGKTSFTGYCINFIEYVRILPRKTVSDVLIKKISYTVEPFSVLITNLLVTTQLR